MSLDATLQQGWRGPTVAPGAVPQTVLVAGGAGALGSQVLEALLARRRHAHVKVLVTRPLTPALRGLEPLLAAPVDALPAAPLADCALVVFDRERRANGREQAFARPEPRELPALAGWLRRGGVRQLIVVMPHSPAGLPDALKRGLADLDEHAVTGLGFDHLVFVRTAQAPPTLRAEAWLQRLADVVLAQLRLMIASPQQPVRPVKVARFIAELAVLLPQSTPGTRVAPPELVWLAAQGGDLGELLAGWLAHAHVPETHAPRRRF